MIEAPTEIVAQIYYALNQEKHKIILRTNALPFVTASIPSTKTHACNRLISCEKINGILTVYKLPLPA